MNKKSACTVFQSILATANLFASVGGCGDDGSPLADAGGSGRSVAGVSGKTGDASVGGSNSGSPPPPPTAGASGQTAQAGQSGGVGTSLADQIAAVAFDNNTVWNTPEPVLMLQNGFATYEVELLLDPAADVAVDMREHPTNWFPWQRALGKFELQSQGMWNQLPYEYECHMQPKNLQLSEFYESDVRVLTSHTITRYSFNPDGTYESCESKLLVASGLYGTDYTRHDGTYIIDGFTIALKYTGTVTRVVRSTSSIKPTNGSETQPLFYDPAIPARLWIDRTFYEIPASGRVVLCAEQP